MLLLAETQGSTIIALVVLAVASLILLTRSNRYFRRSGQQPQRVSFQQSPADADRWQVEMHELGRDLAGQLDSKMAALQYLIRSADEATARLEDALHQLKAAERADDEPGETLARAPVVAFIPSSSHSVGRNDGPGDAFEASYVPAAD